MHHFSSFNDYILMYNFSICYTINDLKAGEKYGKI